MVSLLWLACTPTPTPPEAVGLLDFGHHAPTNLLWVGVDTLRRDRVGRYGGGALTPTLDRLLSEGVALDQHRSCSNWTYASLVCATAGRSQLDLGFAPYGSEMLPDDLTLLPELLRGEGYRTELVTASGFVGPTGGYSERFHDSQYTRGMDALDINDRALATLETLLDDDTPWFLQLHYQDPHDPYDPPDGWAELEGLAPIDYELTGSEWGELMDEWPDLPADEQALIMAHIDARYAGEIAYWDAALGDLMAELQDMPGALEDTLVVLWADHGEQFWEHGEITHGLDLFLEETASIGGLWTLSGDLGGPGLAPAAWATPTTHVDLHAAAMQGISQRAVDGVSAVLVGDEPDPDRTLSMLRYHLRDDPSLHAIEQSGWRYHVYWDGRSGLYDVSSDPDELVDRSVDEAERAAEMRALLAPQIQALAELKGIEPPEGF